MARCLPNFSYQNNNAPRKRLQLTELSISQVNNTSLLPDNALIECYTLTFQYWPWIEDKSGKLRQKIHPSVLYKPSIKIRHFSFYNYSYLKAWLLTNSDIFIAVQPLWLQYTNWWPLRLYKTSHAVWMKVKSGSDSSLKVLYTCDIYIITHFFTHIYWFDTCVSKNITLQSD